VPPAFAAGVGAKLRLHGVRVEAIPRALDVDAAAYHIDAVTYDPPYEGRTQAHVKGAWRPVRRALAPGAIFVPIDQPRARLAMILLEPEAPD
jgi:hypothetical protein